MSLVLHSVVGFLLRLTFIFYGCLHDSLSEVEYTDVDYKVFTDAAMHVMNGDSPYNRHTYRYSPLIAYVVTPNIFLHPDAGKVIFSLCDILISCIIYQILKTEGLGKSKCLYSAMFWLYNPLSVVISTRGNADSLSALIVLVTTYWFLEGKYVKAGLAHGLSIHLRLYPIIYSLPLYMCLKVPSSRTKLMDLVYPSVDRIKLVIATTLAFTTLFIFFYNLYGDKFVFESLFYHMRRVDIRHNYSVFFYLQYLSFGSGMSTLNKLAITAPLITLLLCISFLYHSPRDLPFCQMTMAFVLVMFNSVITCQYFVWYLCLIPLVLPKLNIPLKQAAILGSMWLLSQLSWLLPAYQLEFKSRQTFLLIWVQGLVFFISNVMVLSALIRGYMPTTSIAKIKTN